MLVRCFAVGVVPGPPDLMFRQRSKAPWDDIGSEPEPTLVGVEHEYQVFDCHQQVDFRRLIHGLDLGQRHLDPADPNAYRLDSGAALTCDEAEAEVALPPVALRPGFTFELDGRASTERARLEALVPNLAIVGYSTHISISVPAMIGDQLALLYARTFAPALMLLMDRPTSPGLLVRPRPGRTELGGEYVDGHRLRVATTFAAGSVLACQAALLDSTSTGLPDLLDVRLQSDDRRFGWFVHHQAFGDDLYERGRRARLVRHDATTRLAQQHLQACWTIARRALDGLASPDELDAVERVVLSDETLPCPNGGPHEIPPADIVAPPSPFGKLIAARQRTGFDIAPVMITWDAAVFVIVGAHRGQRAFVCVPRASLCWFMNALDGGQLDDTIADYVRRRSLRLRRLRRHNQTADVGLYRRLGRRRGLIAPERPAVAQTGSGAQAAQTSDSRVLRTHDSLVASSVAGTQPYTHARDTDAARG